MNKITKAKSVEELPLLLSVEEARQVLGLARNKMYEVVHSPSFPCIKIGKSLRIPKFSLMGWIEKQAGNK